MGMDLVSKLGSYLISTPEGDKVHKYTGQDLLHVCQWRLQHAKVSSDLSTEAASSVFHLLTLDLFSTRGTALHCTFHVLPGPNETCEQTWFTKMFVRGTLAHLYWGNTDVLCRLHCSCGKSVFLILGSEPHASLSKCKISKWKDLDPFVKRCEEASDWWESFDAHASFSPSLQCKRTSLLG